MSALKTVRFWWFYTYIIDFTRHCSPCGLLALPLQCSQLERALLRGSYMNTGRVQLVVLFAAITAFTSACGSSTNATDTNSNSTTVSSPSTSTWPSPTPYNSNGNSNGN